MFEILAPGFIYSILKDVRGWLRGRRRNLTPVQIVQIRQRLKPEFQEKIAERRHQKLRNDVIVRDVKRLDHYPEIRAEARGISPWFRVSLMDTYHRGILIGLSWCKLTKDAKSDAWRYADTAKGEPGERNSILIGYIPFENVESIDWDGDEFYGFPIIYCHFDGPRRQPYERLAFCDQRFSDGTPYFVDIVDYDEVKKLSKKRGIPFG